MSIYDIAVGIKIGEKKGGSGGGSSVSGKLASILDGSVTALTAADFAGVTDIRSNAFANCTSLQTVEIGSSVKTIGYSAFAGDLAMTSVTMPDSVTSLGASVFSACSELKNVRLSGAIKATTRSLFEYCIALEEITLPAAITSIVSYTFRSCDALKTVRFLGSTPPTLQAYPFPDTVERFIVPKGAGETYRNNSSWITRGCADRVVEEST